MVHSKSCLVPLAIAAVGLVAGCASAPPDNPGRLVLVGGALERDHGEVFRRMLEPLGEGGTLGVLPTASGSPDRSGAVWATAFDAWASRPAAEVIPITADDPERALDARTADSIASHRTVFFGGGDQSRIVAVFRPEHGDTPAFAALHHLLDDGGTVAGSSAGAAMMSDPMIRGGSSIGALREGARFDDEEGGGVLIGRGMGLFPYGLVDQHFLARGRLGRLLVALDATGTRLGFGIEEDAAIVVDLATDSIETVGARALLLVDAAGMRGEGQGYRDARISLLGNGDVVRGRNGEVRPARHKRELDTGPRGGETLAIEADPWEAGVLVGVITRLGRGEVSAAHIADAEWIVVIRSLPTTRYFADARTHPETITAVGLALDVIDRATTPPR